jgi:hypothetical protein
MPGLTYERTWQVWDDMRAHDVRAVAHWLTGRVRVLVDGEVVSERSGWQIGLRGTQIDFRVRSRDCVLRVRPMGAAETGRPDLDLVVDGWSVDHGTPMAERLARERTEPSAVARLFLVFLVPIGVPAALRGARNAAGGLEPAAVGAIVAAAAGAAAVGWWLLQRWAASRPPGTARTVGTWAIVAAAYLAFLAILAVAVAIT